MSEANASRGGVTLHEDSPHPDAHFFRVDPPPPGEGNTGAGDTHPFWSHTQARITQERPP
jgi:hypothetical protein